MFPEAFVEKHLVYSKPGDLVYDPFSGRGTTAFQSLLSGRRAICSDISPVAICISRAKIQAPSHRETLSRLRQLETEYEVVDDPTHEDEFFNACFSHKTLRQLTYLRSRLAWQSDPRDCFISTLVLGSLHGESHRSPRYFSNRMPRTIATKPAYSMRWWQTHDYVAPDRDVFGILRTEVSYRYDTGRPDLIGDAQLCDVRSAGNTFKSYLGSVKLVITSPPYLDTTHVLEDQWLRNWFVGGRTRPSDIRRGDDRYTSHGQYWQFLAEAWNGILGLLSKRDVVIVVRIGSSKLSFEEARQGLLESLVAGIDREVSLRSASTSEIVRSQARSFRPNAVGIKREYDFVSVVHAV
ncbi:MAG: DNA methyltransferase [Chloroflexi bacterium]|nr:DNA methyltransferase [Chloroflexota bacterium]